MEMNTASEVISFVRKLEEDSAQFYEVLAQRYVNRQEDLLSFARENRKNIVQIERTYYGVVSDAIEGCFSYKINPEEYTLQTELAENATSTDVWRRVLGMEEMMIKFYSDAAAQSKSLLADIPRVFTMIAKKRDNRKLKLESFINKEG